MISGCQKRTKACLNLAYVAWRFKKQFELTNRQAMQASLNLEWIPERRIPVAKVHF